jgi:hypothetical protein
MRFAEFSGNPIPTAAAAHQGPLTVGAAAVTLLSLLSGAALHADTQFVLVTVETDELRLTVNGTTPTATLGFKCPVDTERLLSRAEADNCKLIRSGSADAKIQVAQYKA